MKGTGHDANGADLNRLRLIFTFGILILKTVFVFPFKIIDGDNKSLDPNKSHHLTVSAYKVPLANIPNSTVVLNGLVEEQVLHILSESLGFTYEIVPPKNELFAGTVLKNGSWTGSYGQIQRREVDMCMSLITPSPDTNKIMDSSVSVFFDDTTIVIPFPEMSARLSYLFKPFNTEVWIGVILSSLVGALTLWAINRFANFQGNKHNTQIGFAYWQESSVRVMLYQGSINLSNRSTAFRLAACLVLLFPGFILSNAYVSVYTGLFAVPKYEVAIRSIEDVAANPSIQPYVNKGSPTQTFLEYATEGTIKVLGDRLRNNPNSKISLFSYRDIADFVKNNNVLLTATSTAVSLVQQSYDKNGKCLVMPAEKTFYSRTKCIMFQKGSPLVQHFDEKVLLMHQSGLIINAIKKASQFRNPCSITYGAQMTHSEGQMNLTLTDFSGAFFVLSVGAIIALLAFIVENMLVKLFHISFA